MSELESKSVPVEELVDGAEAEQQEQEQGQSIPALTIRLPTPSNSRTLPTPPKSSPLEYKSLTFHPQPHESLQELKMSINEWVGGYWLGPYSLRIPRTSSGGKKQTAEVTSDGGIIVPAAVGPGEKLSEWLEVKDVFEGYGEGEGRVLEVVREPYSDFSARQTVLRVLELITPPGSTTHHTSNPLGLLPGATIFESVRDGLTATPGEAVYEEVEVSLPSGKKGRQGKKETVKVKREISSTENPFSDWKTTEWSSAPLSTLPLSQAPTEAQACLRGIQVSPFNPPPPHLKQQGHQLYLTVSILEGDVYTLVCCSRGWYVSRSNVNTFDPTPRSPSDGCTHSLIDLLHTLSPLFSERLALLAPLSQEPPKREPIAIVPVPQYEPAYSYLAPTPGKGPAAEPLRAQMAYLHTGATTADALDAARDWNEELQNVKELPREGMQERVLREKMAHKTWAEFNAASIRVVMAIARGDIPPLNPNEDARGHMWLMSNIFITRAIDCIDTYAHMGGDAAAHISHAKDAAMVRLLNKTDVDGVYVLGHAVVDWQGERWVCQSVLPGIFSRKLGEKDDVEVEDATEQAQGQGQVEEGKEDWVKVGDSPSKATPSAPTAPGAPATVPPTDATADPELAENPLIVYGLDSELTSTIHWDAASHKLMSKLATALRLAPHKVQDGQGESYEFYASAEVKALKGTDGRRYLLDLPRLMPVDVEFLQKDLQGALVGEEKAGEAYPHRVVLLRPELLELYFESEFKRWARKLAAEHAPKADDADKEKDKEQKEGEDGGAETGVTPSTAEDASPAASAAAARKAESDAPVDITPFSEKIKQFDLRFNPDAFVDMPHPRSVSVDEQQVPFIPSTIIDESDPAIKAVRDASLFLRNMAIPALTLDVMMGNVTGLADGASLTRAMHARGINMRYLGHLAHSIRQFSAQARSSTDNETGANGAKDDAEKATKSTAEADSTQIKGYLASFHAIVEKEMILRAAKHILRSLLRGLAPEFVPCAISHFFNCLLGAGVSAEPKAVYHPMGFGADEPEPAYVSLTVTGLREGIISQVAQRFRYALPEETVKDVRKRQVLREVAMRCGIQLAQRDYAFGVDQVGQVNGDGSDGEKEKDKKEKKERKDKEKGKKQLAVPRTTTFVPEDVLCCVPVLKSTAPTATVAEEVVDAGRGTIDRGDIPLGLEIMLEGVQFYEQIHSVIHPEVGMVYNHYASTLYQIARLKVQQNQAAAAAAAAAAATAGDAEAQAAAQAEAQALAEKPLGLDVATAVRLQKQAIIIAERTLGVYHADTANYYFNLAMLENLEGNAQQGLRYFRHCLLLWDVIYGPGHPEINTVLSNAGVVLQAMNENALSLALLTQVQTSTADLFGASHLSNGHALHQLTQGLFLQGDIPKALAVSQAALDIFTARLGADHAQTKEVGKNVELLNAVVENVQRQKEMSQRAKEQQAERLRAAQARVAHATGSSRASGSQGQVGQGVGSVSAAIAAARRRVNSGQAAGTGTKVGGTSTGAGTAAGAEAEQAKNENGEAAVDDARDVDELVKFIQGAGQQQGVKRSAKNALRGKRRTGAKR